MSLCTIDTGNPHQTWSHMPLALSFLLVPVACAVVGVVFGWLAHSLALRYRTWVVILAWVLVTLAATAAMTARIHQQQTALGLTDEQQARFPVFGMFLPLWAAGLACVAFVARRQAVASRGSFGSRGALASLKAFLLGAVAYLVIFAILDVTSLIRF